MQKGVFGRFCLARIDYNQLHPVLHGLLHGLTRVDREALLGDYRISADHDPGFRTGECIWSCHPATVKRLRDHRSEEHTSELQSLMRNSYAVFCLKKHILYIQIKYTSESN